MTKFTNRSKSLRSWRIISVTLMIAVLFVGYLSMFNSSPQSVHAATNAELRQQAKDLQAQIDANKAKEAELNAQADGLQKKLAELDIQIAQINAQIQLTDVKIAQLQDQLEKTQIELDRQKSLLRVSMRALYKKQGASTVELLVGSDTFSQFIDQQEYLERLKTNVQTSTEQVVVLKKQILTQQAEQKLLREAQQGQHDSLAGKIQEQQVILDLTKGQAANYASAAEQIRQQQAAILAQLVPSSQLDYANTSSYPWTNYQPWSFNSCYLDPWGMCVRQCVSYTAWAVAHSGRVMPNWGGIGNANQWPDDARVAGIPVDRNPRRGDVAIWYVGSYGHAMYVESVLNDGRIYVSQFNFEFEGKYSEMTISPTSSMVFIHFP